MYLLTSSDVDRQVLSTLQKKIDKKFRGLTVFCPKDVSIDLDLEFDLNCLNEFGIFSHPSNFGIFYSKWHKFRLFGKSLLLASTAISGLEPIVKALEYEFEKNFEILSFDDSISHYTAFKCDVEANEIFEHISPYITERNVMSRAKVLDCLDVIYDNNTKCLNYNVI